MLSQITSIYFDTYLYYNKIHCSVSMFFIEPVCDIFVETTREV